MTNLIVDPDDLNQSAEIIITTGDKKIQLVKTGNLGDEGVTLQCVYSFLKEEWKSDANLIKFPFPFIAITEEKFELVNGWDFKDATTRNLIRIGGWALKDSSGVSQEEYAGIVTLGVIGGSDQVYYQQVTDGSATNIVLTGVVNQAVKVYGDVTHGDIDYRSYFKIFVREYAKTYGTAQLSDIGVTTMTYQVYRFPLANASDLKVIDTDTVVDGEAPYTGMSIEWFLSAQQRSIGGTNYNFHVIIDGGSGTAEQIYTFVQRQLRKDTDIDAGSGNKIGKVTSGLLYFVGDSLYTMLYTTGQGTYIDDFQIIDKTRLYFTDDTGAVLQFPYAAILTLQFGDNLKSDTSAKFWVFFTNDDAGTNEGRDYGTATAILVKDIDNVDMTDTIDGQSSIQLSFDYDVNVQRGVGSDGEEAPITIVAIGLSTAQFVIATGTITRSLSNVVSLVAALERNYKNA